MNVPLIVTLDLEIAQDHDLERQSSILDALRSDLARLGMPMTLFSTADAAETFREPVRRLVEAGHEIGCHGTDHGPEDDYRRMSFDAARLRIASATERLESASGVRPRSFRGPCMTTSAATQRALVEAGYVSDYSVCPQRIDFWRSGAGMFETARAPRSPFHPAAHSAYARGDSPLLVVPLSGLGIPFVSGALYLFGLSVMRVVFDLLLAEARATGKPIVYLLHSYEFTRFLELRTDRRPVHQRLYLRDHEVRYRRNLDLFSYMISRPDVTAKTAAAFAGDWLGGNVYASPSDETDNQAPVPDPPNAAGPHPLRQ